MAGSNQGVKVGKLFLYPLLQAVSCGAPQVGLSTYVDDTIFRTEGKQQVAVKQMGGALQIFSEQCRQAKLVLSDKSVVVSSSNGAARQVAKEAARHGICISAAETAVDLGIATTACKRRDQTQAKKRAKKAGKRVGNIFRMRKKASLGRFARKLHRTGAQPALVYGHQVLGTAPSLMLGLRRKACRAIAGKGFGRCMTTALALLMGDEDPGLSLPQQLVSEWLQFWRRHPEHHARVKRAWVTIYGELSGRPPERRWAKVKGAVSAIICTLLTAGWDAPTATEWTSDIDELWRMSDGPSEVDDAELLEEVVCQHQAHMVEASSPARRWEGP